jgi:hypothetical protein
MDHQLWLGKRLKLWQESFKSNINTPNKKIEITTPKHGIYDYIYDYKTSHKYHLRLDATTWLYSPNDHVVNITSC